MNTNYKCLSTFQQFEFDIQTNLIYPQAVLVDDINDDGKNELVIGTGNGEIFIYKSSNTTPWLKNSKPINCCITCLCFDDVTRAKRKHLICLDATGNIYLYAINQVRKRYTSDMPTNRIQDWKLELRLLYCKKLLPNPKYVLASDLHNSGTKDLVIAYNDRKVHVYRWDTPITNTVITSSTSSMSNSCNIGVPENGKFVLLQTWEFEHQIHSISICQDFINNTLAKCLLVSQPGGRIFQCKFNSQTITSSSQLASTTSSTSSILDLINTNTTTNTTNTTISTISSQKRQSIVQLLPMQQYTSQQSTSSLTAPQVQPSIMYQPAASTTTTASLTATNATQTATTSQASINTAALLSVSNKKNVPVEEILNLSSELSAQDPLNLICLPTYFITNITCQHSNQYAFLVTFNGDIFFVNLSNLVKKTSKIWHRSINNVVINCFKADLNRDGNDELITIAPDGQIYIVNCNGDIISYDIGEPIHLSYLGFYAVDLTHNFMQYDPSFDIDSCQQAFEFAMDSPPNISPNENICSATNKLYLIFLSSVTNKLFFIQIDHLLSKFSNNQFKYKFENIFTNQQLLSTNLVKNFHLYDSKLIINGIKHLLYNNSNELNQNQGFDESEDFDDANTNQIR